MNIRQTFMGSAILLLLGATLACLAAFGPWVSVTTGFGSVSLSGTSGGDGVVVLVLATVVLLAELCVLAIPYQPNWGTLIGECIATGLILTVGVVDFRGIYDRVNPQYAGSGLTASFGWGYFLLFAAGAVLAVGTSVRFAQINGVRNVQRYLAAEQSRTCPHCGNNVPPDNLFCEACGHNLAQHVRTA